MLTLDSSVDGDYDTVMAKIRDWTWDDAMTARGYEQVMELLSLLEDEEDDDVNRFALALTALTDEAIKHIAHAEGADIDKVSIVRTMLQTAHTMNSNML